MRGNLIFLAIGIVCLSIGLIGLCRHILFFQRAIKVPGRVSDYTTSRGSKGGTVYHAVVSFEFDGELRKISSPVGKSWKPTIGKQCQVGIDPTNFSKARIYTRVPMPWGFLIGFGLTFLLVGFSDDL